MKETELRIGNIIEYMGRITNVDDVIMFETCCNNSVSQPIPLTEKWLKMFGFERIPHFTVANSIIKNIGRNRFLSIGAVGTPNEMLFIYWMNDEKSKKIDDIITLWNYDYDGKLYVNQLQNIFFALTGRELELSKTSKSSNF